MGPDTSVHHACSAKLNGEMFIFGGNANDDKNHLRQVTYSEFGILIYRLNSSIHNKFYLDK